MILCTTYKSYNGITAEIPLSTSIYSESGGGGGGGGEECISMCMHMYVCSCMHVYQCVCARVGVHACEETNQPMKQSIKYKIK